MAKLRFYAARDACLPERDSNGYNLPAIVGAPMRYVGRRHDVNVRGYPATEHPYECEEGTGEAAHLKRHVRDLIPADEYTAAACGVKFVPHEFLDGVWVPKSEAPASAGKAD